MFNPISAGPSLLDCLYIPTKRVTVYISTKSVTVYISTESVTVYISTKSFTCSSLIGQWNNLIRPWLHFEFICWNFEIVLF